MTDRLPANVEIEGAIVARLLVDPDAISLIAGELASEDFYDTSWRRAYQAMVDLSRANKAVDIQTLSDALGSNSQQLGRLVTESAISYRAPLEDYIAIVRRDAFRRRIIQGLEQVTRHAYLEEDREALLAKLNDAVTAINQGLETDQLISPSRAAEVYTLELEQRAQGQHGLLYGFSNLDRILLPAAPGDMIVVAARPSIGKTAFAEEVAETWARSTDHPVLFASLEMSLGRLLDRAIARSSGIPSEAIVRGDLTVAQREAAVAAAVARRNVGLWYLDDPNATTSSVRAAAAKVRLIAGGITAIVVDYLQLLKDPGDQEVQRVTRISRGLKAIALEFHCPILVLSQLNRSVEARDDRHPRLHDLRESGAIEQDADTVISIYRDNKSALTDFSILKQRQGPRDGVAQLWFDSAHVSFVDLPESDPELASDDDPEVSTW